MERVTVAELKAKLSAYLRQVEGGEPVIVVRHGTPVAKLERVTGPQLSVRLPRRPTGAWWTTKGPRVDLDRDILEYLAEERSDLPIAGDTGVGRHRHDSESGPNPE
jgi:antitoxin (DNA-binding transcriptional repressor) of toxin-antitoxin stability system